MSIPIVFLHYGECPYLIYSLSQAKHSNPNSDIYLIGDKACLGSASCEQIQSTSIESYMQKVDFAKWYKHNSPNDFKYELFCFERLFVLRNFMVDKHLRKCTYLDSDVLLFLNEQDRDELGAEIIFNHYGFRSWESLDFFCTFVRETYRDEHQFRKLVAFLNTLEGYAGLSDMVLLEYFRHLYPSEACRLPTLVRKGFICGNINMPEGLEALAGKKKLYLSDGLLYGKYKNPDRPVRMGTLHFQGSSKEHIGPIYSHHGLDREENPLYYNYETRQWCPLSSAPPISELIINP